MEPESSLPYSQVPAIKTYITIKIHIQYINIHLLSDNTEKHSYDSSNCHPCIIPLQTNIHMTPHARHPPIIPLQNRKVHI